jgi:hypothetical protein
MKHMQLAGQQYSSLKGKYFFRSRKASEGEDPLDNVPEVQQLHSRSSTTNIIQLSPYPATQARCRGFLSASAGSTAFGSPISLSAAWDRHAQVKELETVSACIKQLTSRKVGAWVFEQNLLTWKHACPKRGILRYPYTMLVFVYCR